jgi:hypothetical protein
MCCRGGRVEIFSGVRVEEEGVDNLLHLAVVQTSRSTHPYAVGTEDGKSSARELVLLHGAAVSAAAPMQLMLVRGVVVLAAT